MSLPSKELSIAQTHYSEAVGDNWCWHPSQARCSSSRLSLACTSPRRPFALPQHGSGSRPPRQHLRLFIPDDRPDPSETWKLNWSPSSLAEFPISESSRSQVLLKGALSIGNNLPLVLLLALTMPSYRLSWFICVIISYSSSRRIFL